MPHKPDQPPILNASLGEPMPERGSTPPNGQLPVAWRIILQFENGKRAIIDVGDRVVVGRSDSGQSSDLSLDLSPYGAEQSGVSRLHAAFSYQDGAVYIEDLASTNGTRINGFQLAPNRAYRLRDGDELEFGRARLVVRFVRSPR